MMTGLEHVIVQIVVDARNGTTVHVNLEQTSTKGWGKREVQAVVRLLRPGGS